jgi:hypothetical protein
MTIPDPLEQPATKRDIADLRQDLRQELRELGIKVDAYWQASDRLQRLAFALLGTAVVVIIATAVTLILRVP